MESTFFKPTPTGNKGTVLVIEDNAITQMLIANKLKKLGYSADSALNGDDGLKKILSDEQHYAFILLDNSMPKYGDGLNLLKELGDKAKKLPIAMQTSDHKKILDRTDKETQDLLDLIDRRVFDKAGMPGVLENIEEALGLSSAPSTSAAP